MIKQIENWKPIPKFSRYEASNKGRIRSLWGITKKRSEPLIIGQGLCRGYHTVLILSDENIRRRCFVHVLIAETYISERPSPNHVCNHKDGKKSNNYIENLEWSTASEDAKHAYKLGLNPGYVRFGDEHTRASLSKKDVLRIKDLLDKNVTHRKIAKEFNISKSAITAINLGLTWRNI